MTSDPAKAAVDRRCFIGTLAGGLTCKLAAGLVAAPLAMPRAAGAQQAGKMVRIGYLSAPTRASVEPVVQSFLRSLREMGWIEGKNLVIEYRWAEGRVERLPELAAELVRSKVDLIVAPAGSAALAAKNATSTIPVVMIFAIDPVGMGLVASMRRPGGNVTGTTGSAGLEIYAKQLQMLKELVPQASRVALLRDVNNISYAGQLAAVDAAARSLGISLQVLQARGPEDFDGAFAAMARERTQALFLGRNNVFLVHRDKIAELALKAQLPTMCGYRESVEAGGLIAYTINMSDFIGRAASYVDKILKGANPADMPVEQPSKFDLSINLKTAKALGLTIPQSLLLRANEVFR
jgi:putative tryptophan/tyrosine transport system substrate-binding protein